MKKITKSKWQIRRIKAAAMELSRKFLFNYDGMPPKERKWLNEVIGDVLMAADLEEAKLVKEYADFANGINPYDKTA